MNPVTPPDRKTARIFRAAQQGDARRVEQLIAGGVPVNSRDRATGATALHYAAAGGSRGVLRTLIKSPECDFLVRDKKGRLPSELAGVYGRDPAMARLLLKKEVAQARTLKLQLHRRADRVKQIKARPPNTRATPSRPKKRDIDRER